MLKQIEISLRHFLLKTLLLFSGAKKNLKPDLKKGSKILIIRLNRIGDALVTTPLIKILSETGGFEIFVLADKKNKFIFENNPFVHEVIEFKKGLSAYFNLVQYLNSLNFEIVIDAHPDVSTTVSFIVASLKTFTLGFTKGNEKIYSETITPLPKEKHHIIERLLQFADYLHLTYQPESVNVVYKPKEKSIEAVRKELKTINPENKFLLGINISAGSEARFWGIENYGKLLDLLSNFEVIPVILSSPQDAEKAKIIARNRCYVFNSPDFDSFAAMISFLNFLFTPDTSAVHLASAFEIPMFGIYVKYNTTEKEWYPYRSEYELVVTTEPNFKNLTFETVKEKFLPFLSKFAERKS